jgi:Cu/Ag efflux protein CusF
MSRNLLRTVVALSVAGLALSLALPARAAEEQKAEKKKEKRYEGTIEAIDTAARTVTVKKKIKSETFKCTDDCVFVTKDKKEATINDLKVGDAVNVIYWEEDGKKICRRVAHKGLKPGEKAAEEKAE